MAGNKKVDLLLIGSGLMGKTHLKGAKGLASARYVGVADLNAQAAQAIADEFGIAAFTDATKAIEELKPQAVDICVPTPFHLQVVEKCAELGVHILCEKPVALTLKDAKKMRELVEKSGTRLMIAQVLRFWPEYVHAVEAVKKGGYGRILSVDCRRLSSPPGWNSWMLKPGIGEGAAVDLQIHDMDFVLELLGKPQSIIATGRKTEGAWNSVHSKLVYASGVPALVQASYLMPGSYPFRMYFLVQCEKAVIEMDFWRPKGERLRIYPEKGEAFCPKLAPVDAYGAEVDYFCQCLRKNKPFSRVPLDESINALAMCLASRNSCETGKAVRFSGV